MTKLTGTPAEVADRLGCCEKTVRQLIASKRLGAIKLAPRTTVVAWTEVEAFLERESAAALNGHDEAQTG